MLGAMLEAVASSIASSIRSSKGISQFVGSYSDNMASTEFDTLDTDDYIAIALALEGNKQDIFYGNGPVAILKEL